MTLDALHTFFSSFGYCTETEELLQQAVEKLLRGAGIDYAAQFRLSASDRVDVLVGRVGIELKIKGRNAEIVRQLHRYVQHDAIDGILLITSRARHQQIPDRLNGKTIRVLWVGGAAL
jgi:hypothetical protein